MSVAFLLLSLEMISELADPYFCALNFPISLYLDDWIGQRGGHPHMGCRESFCIFVFSGLEIRADKRQESTFKNNLALSNHVYTFYNETRDSAQRK